MWVKCGSLKLSRLILLVAAIVILGYLLARSRFLSSSSSSSFFAKDETHSIVEFDGESKPNLENAKKEYQTRKILLDCGANVASSVELFKTTYPDSEEYEIYSFELDGRLAPYFASYDRHRLFCPAAVTDFSGNVQAYAESPWSPTKGKVDSRDVQWGGGAIVPYENEKKDKDGGRRKLNFRKNIQAIDLAQWMKEHLKKEDYVILKMDVEGAEYEILRKILDENVFELVDKFYGEFHPWQPLSVSKEFQTKLHQDLKNQGIYQWDWLGEISQYQDFLELNKKASPEEIASRSGPAGIVHNGCADVKSDGRFPVSIGVAVGTSLRLAKRLVATLIAFKRKAVTIDPPITLFVYSEFLEDHPDLVESWSHYFDIATRGERPFLPGIFENLQSQLHRKSIAHMMKIFKRRGVNPKSYLSQIDNPGSHKQFPGLLHHFGMPIVVPTVKFPPANMDDLEQGYMNTASVHRTPRALRYIYSRLKKKGGILVLDSDFDDTFLISIFLLDYLTDYQESNKEFYLASTSKCLTGK